MNRRSAGRLFDLIVLAIGLACLAWALHGCTRANTTTDGTKDRTTVTKETRIREGTDPFKETVYREEVSKEVAHSEQERVVTVPAADAFCGLIDGIPSTGNPVIDGGLLILGLIFGKKGAKKAGPMVSAGVSAVASKFKKKDPK